jgi:hypothetical protein
MTPPADPTVFEDTDRQQITISEEELLGKHTYSDVLYTGSTDVVDIRTGATPSDLDRTAEQAQEFAESTTTTGDPPRVARKLPPEQAVESRSPYVSSAFFHMSITGGYDWHTVFRRAWDSSQYHVAVAPDYDTGTLTITVERTR